MLVCAPQYGVDADSTDVYGNSDVHVTVNASATVQTTTIRVQIAMAFIKVHVGLLVKKNAELLSLLGPASVSMSVGVTVRAYVNVSARAHDNAKPCQVNRILSDNAHVNSHAHVNRQCQYQQPM